MTRLVYCAKLQQELEGMAEVPLPGAVGTKLYEQISNQAWQMWIKHQTMLINEHRLSMIEPKSRAFLMQEMDKFLFGQGSEKPAGYTPEKT